MAGEVLHVVSGAAAGERLPVGDGIVLGREVDGAGRIPSDSEISRRHARIDRRDGTLLIEDLDSHNGTWVNGARLAARHPLRPGDQIRLGRTTLELEPAGRDRATPAAERRPGGRGAGQPSPPAGPPPPSPARASVAELLHAGRRLRVGAGGAAIGRDQTAAIVIDRPTVSRRQAVVVPAEDGGVFVADLGSVNGTLLNGERLRGEARWLRSGDTIAVDGDPIRFVHGVPTALGGSATAPGGGVQVVSLSGERLRVGRDPSNEIMLADPNVSRLHAEVVRAAGGLELRDLGSRNGTRLNGRRVERARVAAGDEIGVGPFRLLFDGDNLLTRDDRGALRLDALEVTVRAGGREILKRASLSVEPGEFVVIIGESGSGKSTLIKALAGVHRPTDGSITVSGDPVATRLTDIGYVPQDEIVHPLLTTGEALAYSARLRLPQDTSDAEVRATVDRVLAELSLVEQRDVRIGSLSGGQRKRAGVGVELLSRPSLLFLDEPTTGLDPGLESRLMELFRELAQPSTRAVIVVTHATKNLAVADRLVVMGRGGDLTFEGPPEAALDFFGVETYDDIYAALERRPAVEWRRSFEAERHTPVAAGHSDVHVAVPRHPATGSERRPRAWPQARLLSARYARLMVRDTRNMLILLGQVPVIAAGIALLFRGGVFDRPGQPNFAAQLLFLLVTTAIWLGAIDGSREIIKERSVASREAAVGVRLGAYISSKAVVLFALAAVQAVLLAAIVLLAHPLHEPLGSYASVLVLLVLTSFVAVGVGLAVSAAVDTEDQATSFIPLTLIPQLLFAGALVPVAKMSGLVSALSLLVFARWSFAGAGTSIDLNERFAADRAAHVASGYGSGFFDVSTATAALVLAAFLGVAFALAAALTARRA